MPPPRCRLGALLCLPLLACFALAPSARAQGPPPPAHIPQTYQFAWGDEFNYTGSPDPNKWSPVWNRQETEACNASPGWARYPDCTPFWPGPDPNRLLDYQRVVYDAEGGRLELRATAIANFPCWSPVYNPCTARSSTPKNFQQGGVTTIEKKYFQYGYFELRAKWPRHYDLVEPNWWFFGPVPAAPSNPSAYNLVDPYWLASGEAPPHPSWSEVDVFETQTRGALGQGWDNAATFSLHLCTPSLRDTANCVDYSRCHYDCHLDKWDRLNRYYNRSHPLMNAASVANSHQNAPPCHGQQSGWTCASHPMTDDGWHTYGLWVTPSFAKLYIDGVLMEEVHADWLAFLLPMQMFIHLGVASHNGHTPQSVNPFDPTLANFVYSIDYVRVWQ